MNWMKGLWSWVDARLPVQRAWDTHMGKYYAPKNFNFWYFFGVLSILVLVNQLLTGIWLTMNYTPSAEEAFASVEYIMRDVDYGWILRYMHSTGASAFFVVVYLHMFRGLMYGSYKAPRELVWIFGMTIYLVLMAEAFMGYVLPWGQMSYWGAQVIVSLVGAIPVVGDSLVEWIRGDFLISGITLNRFFALHVVALPIVLLGLVVLHLLALHEVGSNNPDGIEIKKNKDENGIPKDGVAFHPFYTVHDLVGVSVFLFVFCFVLFFMPEMGGFFLEYANFEEANNLKTPAHIAPVWYFTPFYAILRAINFPIGPLDAKFLGLVAMGAAIAILFVLPWLDKSPVKSMRYKGTFSRVALIVFAAAFVILGYLGVKSPTPGRTILAQICTILYFAYFIGMPFWTKREKTQPEPDRVRMKGLPLPLVLGGFALFAVLVVVPIKAVGAEGAFDCGAIPCDAMEPDLENKASLQRGAKYFVNYCMGCHSAKFSRYERVADDLGIPHDLMMENMVFGTDEKRIGDLMEISMSKDLGKQWFGAAPPDLTLVARARNPQWLYTYLRNFYKDESRPLGVNNRVFANVGMPHVMLELQGLHECGAGPKIDSHGHAVRDDLGNPVMDEHCGALVEGDIKGTMTTEEFDRAIFDLVNFLEYVAEPSQLDRKRIGVFVLLFICVLFVFTYLLNREYWKGIH
ncbi:ubiquinol-cytochrome c reductase [Gilvimarinus sp. SDUM040013]|uniref:Cytochrome b n=1 Tax=Gilvimarinus gilvus TaxID=3058038 RepID=A0ABU4RSJ7_9GAMM|nr:ubiquinol-cytochrome c reductase [Gilvimarinus sp. SDUM040013]MDO3388330.1 ubiquinol-cytochrome c reductase [Gilvimarinus sp. SDUM040013]MDX6847880.1 ubiquinol-cytochrome c reductase [Gilvimarinus sp. SDUM040013]